MYIKVILGEYTRGEISEDAYHPSVELLVNPDCPIRVLDGIVGGSQIALSRGVVKNIDEFLVEIDLCDENGNLVFIYDKEPWMNGLNYLLPKSTYLVILFEKDEDNRVKNPMLHLPDLLRKSAGQWSEIMSKIKKQLSPGVSNKPSRSSRTRISTTAIPK